jgi:NADPH:quinone reductase-like Zn-dependent oxidoreductase
MRGVVYRGFGPPERALRVMEGPRPLPGAGQVLVKVAASTVNIIDYLRFTANTGGGTPLWVRALDGALGVAGRPLGCEVAGTVASVGPGVEGLAVGDQVFASVGLRGGWAEYALAGAGRACRKPAGLSWAQAAALPVAGSTALGAVEAAGAGPGSRVLVYGAAGGVGHLVVQIAHARGAEVTAVCGPRSAESARTWGADRVLDYRGGDLARDSGGYDAVIAVNGYQPVRTYKRLLAEQGVYVVVGPARQALAGVLAGPLLMAGGGQRTRPMVMADQIRKGSLDKLASLAERGQVAPHIDHAYTFAEAPEAIRYITTEHARGKVALVPAGAEQDA